MAQPAKVLQFAWEGKDSMGKAVNGDIAGTSLEQVRSMLRRRGIRNPRIRKRGGGLFSKGEGGGNIKAKDIAVFSRQLATMMSSGVPLVQSFEIIGRGHEKPKMSQLLNSIRSDVEAGLGLAEAMSKYPMHFDALYTNLVAAGEQAGILEDLLDKIATYKEKTEEIKAKVKKAMFYPIAVVAVAVLVTFILLLFVVPQFEALFADFGAELPGLTRMVIGMSVWLQGYWWMVLLVLGGGIYAFVQGKKRSRAFARMLDVVVLKIPIIGPILEKSAIARYARTMSTMFAAGTPLVESMESVAGATGNAVYYEATMKMRDEIATGTSLNVAMKGTRLFPNMVNQMVEIGEEAGSLDQMLGKVADFYEAEVDAMVDALSSLLEPIILVFLGGTVGTLVIAMYLPIFKLGQVV